MSCMLLDVAHSDVLAHVLVNAGISSDAGVAFTALAIANAEAYRDRYAHLPDAVRDYELQLRRIAKHQLMGEAAARAATPANLRNLAASWLYQFDDHKNPSAWSGIEADVKTLLGANPQRDVDAAGWSIDRITAWLWTQGKFNEADVKAAYDRKAARKERRRLKREEQAQAA